METGMDASQASRGAAAARSIATSLGLDVDASTVLNNSNKLTLRLLPCDVVARVAPAAQQIAQFEVDLSQQLVAVGSPIAALEPRVEPRVYECDDFVITLWTYYERVSEGISSAEYASALERLHAGMRRLDVRAPHFTERIDEAEVLVGNREQTPELAETDRDVLRETLGSMKRAVIDRGATDQLLHGEPHPGNVLVTGGGPVFVDIETCCRGPVEFDLAHAPEGVAEHYPGINSGLLRNCRMLVLAMITTWRWDRSDQFPDGRRLAAEWMRELRDALDP
jgi:hypothetical protein